MGFGFSLFLIAVGAILTFAVHVTTHGMVNLHSVGEILMVIGVIGALITAVVWAPWTHRGDRVVERHYHDEF